MVEVLGLFENRYDITIRSRVYAENLYGESKPETWGPSVVVSAEFFGLRGLPKILGPMFEGRNKSLLLGKALKIGIIF